LSRELDIGDYQERLNKLVEKGKIKCPRCGNTADFLVNEIGHVFCSKCHTKIPMVRLEKHE
jgi:ribosomal protein S27AE